MINSDARIKELFFELEEDQQTFDFKIRGYSLYFLLRFQLEMQLRFKENNFFSNLKYWLTLRLRGIKKSKVSDSNGIDYKKFDSLEKARKSPLLFMATCALSHKDGGNIDLLDIVEYYSSKGININFIQPEFGDSELPSKSEFYDAYLLLSYSSTRINKTEKKELKRFLNFLKKKLKVSFDLQFEAYADFITDTFGKSKALEEYLSNLQPKFLFARSVYTEPWVVMACFEKKVKLIEVQHGVVGPDNIYYQSSINIKDQAKKGLLFPDYIFTLGESWKKILIEQNSIFNHENVFNLGLKENLNPIQSNNQALRILVLLQGRRFYSQFSIPNFIKEFIIKYTQFLLENEIQIILRPHPADLKEVEAIDQINSKIVKVENTLKVASLDSIKESDLIVSATSMGLYEGLSMGKTAVSFEAFAESLADNKNIFLINSIEDFKGLIDKKVYKMQKKVEYLSEFQAETLELIRANR